MTSSPNSRASAAFRALLTTALSFAATLANGEELTPHPENWRPIVYRDLQIPGPEDRVYVDLWADAIQSNNRRYLAAGDRRYAAGNAPVREAHVTVRGGNKVALLSILDTATGCVAVTRDTAKNVSVKMCPMRLSFWNGSKATIKEAKGCYLEPGSREEHFTADPSYAVSYVSYDTAAKSIKLGVILAHRAVEQCSQTVTLYP